MVADRFQALAAVVIAVSCGSFAVGQAPLGAQPGEPPELPMSISPTSGPIGTEIVISGEGCFGPDGGAGDHVWLAGVEDQGDYMPFEATAPVRADGTWEHRFTLAPDPPSIESLSIYGSCFDTPDSVSGHYPAVLFDVVRSPAPTEPPPTTRPPAPEPPVPVAPGVQRPSTQAPSAPVAAPVLGQPTYTG